MSRQRLGALALLALVLALGAAELGARFVLLPRYWRPVPPFGAITNEHQRAWLERQRAALEKGDEGGAGEIGIFDPELGWCVRPGVRSPDGRTTIHARGWRGGRDYPVPRPEGRLRIATFGDSFTFCEEVADAETWQAQLEELRPDLDVVNLGVGGYGTDQALLRARRELPALDADLVLVGLLLENVGRNVNRYRPLWYPSSTSPVAKPRFVLADGRLELVPQPFATRRELLDAVVSGEALALLSEHEHWSATYVPAVLRWSAAARLLGARRAYAARGLPRLWADEEGEPFRVTVALIEAFAELARQSGSGEAWAVVFPIESDLRHLAEQGERYWEPLLEHLRRAGIPCLDASTALAPEWDRGAPVYAGSHLGPLGNELVAVEVRRLLAGVSEGR